MTLQVEKESVSAQEAVKLMQPKAFLHKDGEIYYILLQEMDSNHCPQSGSDFTKTKPPQECPIIGQGETADQAWFDAVICLASKAVIHVASKE